MQVLFVGKLKRVSPFQTIKQQKKNHFELPTNYKYKNVIKCEGCPHFCKRQEMTSKHIIFLHLSFFIWGNTILRLYYCPSEDNVKIILFFHTTLWKNRHESFALKSNGVKGCATERFISHISELWPPDVLQGFPSNLPSILIFEHLNPFLRFWKSPPVWPSLRGHAHHRPPSIIVTRSLRLHHLINSSWAVEAVRLHLYPCRIESELEDALHNYLLFRQGQHSDSQLHPLHSFPIRTLISILIRWGRFYQITEVVKKYVS